MQVRTLRPGAAFEVASFWERRITVVAGAERISSHRDAPKGPGYLGPGLPRSGYPGFAGHFAPNPEGVAEERNPVGVASRGARDPG